jgi:5'-nucleotidase
MVPRVLLTNDDGLEAEGLQSLRRALVALDGIQLVTIAPDGNRSAIGRGITTREALWVEEVDQGDGTVAYATSGTPVDCVRLALLGLVEDFRPEIVVSGINHGVNLGDDISYSGTVAAALEGLLYNLPAIAVSQQSTAGDTDFRVGYHFDFTVAAQFTASIVDRIDEVPPPTGTLINVNVPGRPPTGVEITRIGKRIYRDALREEVPGVQDDARGRRRYWIDGEKPHHTEQPGTDLAAVAAGRIAVTPIHFDLTDVEGMATLERYDLGRLIAAAAATDPVE